MPTGSSQMGSRLSERRTSEGIGIELPTTRHSLHNRRLYHKDLRTFPFQMVPLLATTTTTSSGVAMAIVDRHVYH